MPGRALLASLEPHPAVRRDATTARCRDPCWSPVHHRTITSFLAAITAGGGRVCGGLERGRQLAVEAVGYVGRRGRNPAGQSVRERWLARTNRQVFCFVALAAVGP